jgi:hypothetical protein
VVALHHVLEALRKERRVLNGRRIAAHLLLSMEEYQAHLKLLENFEGIPESLRRLLISEFKNGVYYGSTE